MKYNYDVVVVGGGTSGVVVALGLAQSGHKVCIIESQTSLGGTQTNALVNPFMPSHVYDSKYGNILRNEYKKNETDKDKMYFAKALAFNDISLKETMENLLTKSNVDIFYSMTLIGASVVDGKISNVLASFMGDNYEFTANNYVDATANGVLAKLSGLNYFVGDENNKNQSVSLRFEIGGIDIEELKKYLKTVDYQFCDLNMPYLEFVSVPNSKACGKLPEIFNQAVENNELSEEDVRYIQGFTVPNKEGVLSFNGPQLPNVNNVMDPLGYSKYIIKGHDMQIKLAEFLKANIPGFSNSYISQSATMLGIRESVRIEGDYILNEDDYINRRKFDDAVAKGDWYIDVHTDDLDVEDDDFKAKFEDGEYYEIPFRSLINSQVKNLSFVGRHISSTFKMQSSVRIQHTCYDMASSLAQIIDFAIKNDMDLTDVKDIKKILKDNND